MSKASNVLLRCTRIVVFMKLSFPCGLCVISCAIAKLANNRKVEIWMTLIKSSILLSLSSLHALQHFSCVHRFAVHSERQYKIYIRTFTQYCYPLVSLATSLTLSSFTPMGFLGITNNGNTSSSPVTL